MMLCKITSNKEALGDVSYSLEQDRLDEIASCNKVVILPPQSFE